MDTKMHQSDNTRSGVNINKEEKQANSKSAIVKAKK